MLTELSDEDIDIGSPRPFDQNATAVVTLGDIWQSNLKYTRRVFAGGENPALVIGCIYVIWQGGNTAFVWDGWRAQLRNELRQTAAEIAKRHATAPATYMPFYASMGRGMRLVNFLEVTRYILRLHRHSQMPLAARMAWALEWVHARFEMDGETDPAEIAWSINHKGFDAVSAQGAAPDILAEILGRRE